MFWTKNSGRRTGELKNGVGEASIVGAAKREPDRFRFVDMVELDCALTLTGNTLMVLRASRQGESGYASARLLPIMIASLCHMSIFPKLPPHLPHVRGLADDIQSQSPVSRSRVLFKAIISKLLNMLPHDHRLTDD